MAKEWELSEEQSQALYIDLAAFEGPLDLLLHLIRQMKVDIFDIPIVEITEKYLALIQENQSRNLEVASEYLVMAATLIEIKANMLLPKPEEEEEEVDPRQDLVEQLVNYQNYKRIGHLLEEKQELRAQEYPRQASDLSAYQVVVPLPKGENTTDDLVNALRKMVRRLKDKAPLEKIIQAESYTLQEAFAEIKKAFEDKEGEISFFYLLSKKAYQKERIVTLFLALLQLAKQQVLVLEQDAIAEDIRLTKRGEF